MGLREINTYRNDLHTTSIKVTSIAVNMHVFPTYSNET